jgi:hypothetical protein
MYVQCFVEKNSNILTYENALNSHWKSRGSRSGSERICTVFIELLYTDLDFKDAL